MDPHQRRHRRARGQVLAARGAGAGSPPRRPGATSTVSVELLAGQLQLGAALGQDGLPVADFLQRVLVPPLGHLQVRLGGVELGPGDELLLEELDDLRSRVSRASSSTARAWRTMAVCSGSTCSSLPVGVSPSRARACCSAASACSRRSLKSVWSSRADRLAAAHPAAQIDVDGSTRPATLALRMTWSSAARVPVAATVRGSARSAAGTTRTSRAGGRGWGLGRSLGRWPGCSPRQPTARGRPVMTIKGRPDIRLMISRRRAASPTKMQTAADELQRLLDEVQGQPAEVAERTLEELDGQEEHDAEPSICPHGFAQRPLQARHSVRTCTSSQTPTAAGAPITITARRQPRGQRILRVHEEPRGDDLGAEQHTVEIDLADADHGHRRDDGDLEHGGLAARAAPPALAERDHAGGGGQHDLQPLHHVVLVDQPGTEPGRRR